MSIARPKMAHASTSMMTGGTHHAAARVLLCLSAAAGAAAGQDSVATILGRIVPPTFPAQDFVVPQSTDANAAINAAIDRAHSTGGKPSRHTHTHSLRV